MNDERDKPSLSEAFQRAMFPTEEDIYKRCINQGYWSIEGFAALINGLTPENYVNGTKGNMQISEDIFNKRYAHATKIHEKFLKEADRTFEKRDFIYLDEGILMSSWKFIKWAFLKNISMHKRFIESLPFILLQLGIEFRPTNVILRTASRYSKAYHKALYLHHAEKLIEKFPTLDPTEIYRHPHMQGVQRYIRDLGGSCKKRTITESWLSSLQDRPRGRPKKSKDSLF